MYSYPSPQQSTTSLSDDEHEEDDIDKSTFFLEPVSPARWSSKMRQLSPIHKSAVQHSPASKLPPEILIHIFKQLHGPRDLHSTLLVSRTWCECSVELLWHKPHFSKLPSLFKMISVIGRKDMTFTYSRFVRRLNFLTLGSDLSNQLFTRLAVCTRLERLTLVNCSSISDEALVTVLPRCPNLVALDLTNVVETTDRAITALADTAIRLQGLNLGGCKLVTHKGVLAIAENCRQLRRIKLSGLELLTDNAVSALARSCPLLLEIDLNGCERITDASIRDLWTHSVHMREFRLSHCPELGDNAFPSPPKDTSPAGPNPFPNSNTSVIPQYPPLKLSHPFEHLRMLDLTSCGNLTDQAVEGIVTNAPKIRNLVLAKCVGLTDAAVESICKLGKNLHYLHLGHATGITDRSVIKLARSCLRLRYIDLACCALLTDLSVFELASLSKLRRIGLVRVVNLTDQAIMTLGERRRDTLERIHLSYCEQITIPAIHFLLQKLTRLTHLSLTGIPAFRQDELQQYCRSPPREFNSAQRAAFCVYSGTGVRDLRRYLETILPPIGDDGIGRYDSDEDDRDGNAFAREHLDDSERDEYTNGGLFTTRSRRSSGLSTVRAPPFGQPPNSTFMSTLSPGPEVAVQSNSTTSAASSSSTTPSPFEQPISETQTTPSTFRRLNVFARSNGHHSGSSGRSNQAQTTQSNPGSTRSSQSNGVGFMNSYDPAAMQAEAAMVARNGAATPDLIYAELGHGPGAWVDGPGPTTLAARLDTQVDEQRTYPDADTWRSPYRVENPASNLRRDIATATVTSTYGTAPAHIQEARILRRGNTNHSPSPSPSPSPSNSPPRFNRELEDPVQSALSGLTINDTAREGDGHTRRSRLSLRNTLNAAENYASSILFGHHGPNDAAARGGTAGGRMDSGR